MPILPTKRDTGAVYLIGAGPGDPGLLTLKGAEILRFADVIVYDRLVHPNLLQLARPDAKLVYVGKASADHAMKQPDINALLVRHAATGCHVARLKGGDPFVFGRGGEEAEYCRAHGISFEIVPGVTSAIAAAAYAGIPITHRDAASSFAVVTGHEREDTAPGAARAAEQRRNWKHIAWAADTLVFLMGIENLGVITSRLIEHGRDPETPTAIIQWGTWDRQRVVTGTLSNVQEIATQEGIASPSVCVVGDVVRLRDQLRWFDDPRQRPLLGRRILVTRAREQASALSDRLRELGAEPVEFPTIRIVRRSTRPELEIALNSLNQYRWLLFTSTNSVQIFYEALQLSGRDSRALYGLRICAVGPATAQVLRQALNIQADFVPSDAVGESVVKEWPDRDINGGRVLLPCAAGARTTISDGLRQLGASVHVVELYDNEIDTSGSAALRSQLEAGQLDALTFTSSSTVSNFIKAIGVPGDNELRSIIGRSVVAAIGPVTADTLKEYGIQPQLVAEEHTIHGLVNALTAWYNTDASAV